MKNMDNCWICKINWRQIAIKLKNIVKFFLDDNGITYFDNNIPIPTPKAKKPDNIARVTTGLELEPYI